MTTGHVFIAVSLDGYIARKDHAIDWLENQGTTTEEHGYTQFIDSVDGIIFGRKTYEVVLDLTSGEWPYAKPVIVLSRTLTNSDIPPHLNRQSHDHRPNSRRTPPKPRPTRLGQSLRRRRHHNPILPQRRPY